MLSTKPNSNKWNTTLLIRHLVMLNSMRCYVLKTKVKNLDPKVIKGFSNIVKLIMTNYAYGENVYHEEKGETK